MEEKKQTRKEKQLEKHLEAVVEAVLFTMGKSVELRQLAIATGQSEEETRQAVERLKVRYDKEERGMEIIELEDSYQMCTRTGFYENLIRVAATPKKQILTDVVLETLSIIAYKQPITRIEVDDIRGVNSSGAISKLLSFELIREDGKKEVIGRPNLYVTTDYFLDYMGINHLEELPIVEETELIGQESQLFTERTEEIDEN